MVDSEVVLKAEDIAHVLRDCIALLPGSRDRNGRAIIIFPPKEQQLNPDNIRNILRYLHTVTADEARELGFTVIIDMRGKHAYNNVRPILKAINHLCETTTGLNIMILVIKPDKFWEKQKANILLGSWTFEVHMISIDALAKFVDSNQLIRDLGGSFPYDHDDWLDTRLELERWIWQVSEVMRNLECQRRFMTEAQSPVDVATAETALSQHSLIKKTIFAVPIERLQSESDRISERINRAQCGISNPDLVSSIPHMVNLLTSLRSLKNDVFKQWENRRVELEGCYQMKLFEHDADEMLDWTRKHCESLARRMGDIGSNDLEASEKLREFEEFSSTAANAEVNIVQVANIAVRLRSVGSQSTRNKLERTKLRLEEEWSRFQEQLLKRKLILNAAVAFFVETKVYFNQFSSWIESPGVDPVIMNGKTAEILEEAIQEHEKFWAGVEEIYAEAFAQGSQLAQLLKSVDVDDCFSKEQLGKLTKAHKHLLCMWKERRVRLHSMLALIAFRTDTQLVVEWLEQHGDPYLIKNISIGETVEQARTLQRNHSHFRQIAKNTYSNANKLFEASKAILESGVCDAEKMRTMIGDLDQRIQQFTHRVEARFNLLNQSVLFHTHYHEIMAWYDEMEKKYAERVVDSDVESCERSKEQWLYESDGTAQAYATTIGEGTQLVHELEIHSQHNGIDYTSNIACINRLIRSIESRNSKLSTLWNPQRILLQIGLRFAVFVRDNCEVLSQIRSWEEDMRGMLESSTFAGNAEKVLPFHQDNTAQVKMAVKNIRKCAQEVLQSIHGNGFSDLRTRQGKSVTDLIKENLRILEAAEHQVMQYAAETSYRIEGSRKLGRIRNVVREIVAVFDREERALQAMSAVPVDLEQALRAQEAHELFIKRIELNNMDSVRVFYELSNDLIREGCTDRAAVVELNEMVTGRWRRLSGLAEERNKLLKAAIVCYKTYLTGVYPILDQLEKDYSQNPDRDWCAVRVGETPQERVNVISELLSKHMDYKDRFLKGCIYAQKTSELFLKYIERTSTGSGVQNRVDSERIIRMKSDLRERQSKILELWTKKKKQLDRCQQFVLMDATRHVIVDWLCGEGERRLAEFMSKGVADQTIMEDFHTFKLAVKEERAKIQTLLCMAGPIRNEAKQHAADIAECMDDVRLRFEKFSRRVAECETILRGGKPSTKDDLSLDRLSDASVEENVNAMKREQNRKMKEPMHELIKSERDYIEDLKKCIQVYISEYDAAETNSTLPSVLKDRRQAIFGNYEKLYAFHAEKFIHELAKYEDDPEEVGCSFTVWVDYLNELYTDYCVNMEQNNHVVALPEAVAFFESVREKHGLEQNNSLHSMRIKPVQRCTRYKLLMEQLLKHCSNVEEIREAYDVVKSLPRRVNDIIHFNGLEKDKLGVVGPFVMQDLLTVWEPRNYFNKAKGKERQVFLFEQAVVIAKKVEFTPKNVKYIIKGKPVPLADVSVVEHVEGDSCRFGLRIGTVASNENRIDLRSAPQPKEEVKIMWVKRIRELKQALLPLNLGVGLEGVPSSGSSSSVPSVTARSSNASANSFEIGSRDTDETSSLDSQRLSVQSVDSNQQSPEQWVVSADFDDKVAGHLSVWKGEKVEMLEQQNAGGIDWVHVVIVDDSTRTGLVPCSILLPDAPSSSFTTDRPDAGSPGGGVMKRKSLRRIFGGSNPSKDHHSPSSPTSRKRFSEERPRAVLSSCDVEPADSTRTGSAVQDTVLDGELSPEAESNCCASVDEGLPPPMDEITLNNSHMNEDTAQETTTTPEEMRESVEDESPEKQEKTPEEMARLKRQYVLMELVETEKDYVKDLSSVVDGYIANLERMELPDDLVGKDKIIFANIAQILEFHKNIFLKEIEKCLDNYEVAGSAFVKYKGRLETMYVRYCQNKPKSDYLVSQDDFEQFFAETKAKLGHKVALSDLLIKPVQRIMKYQLLLKDILKFTERAKEKTDVLKKALAVMHVVPKACDDMMQVGRLQNFDGSLNAQGKLLYQGTLPISDSQGGTSQKAKDRRIFLFEQSVIIADHIPPKKEFGNPIYIFKNQIMVNKMLFEPSVPDDPLKFIIRSSDPAQPTSFIATAQTQEEKNEWVRYIGEQLDQQKRMLAALVDPRRFMGGATDDLTGAMSGLGMGSDGKKSPSASAGGGAGGIGSSRFGSGSSKTTQAKPDSPKKESKGGKLFGFGKKASAKSPTSPPPC
ncbi:hypothetical protein RB195_006949 [Necator americanus]|uniref:RhoGEF domain protein n=1 Tax=Necator americanus TaxID=51031 RepID=A0ABR1BXU7_NECAM